jgi:CheY-like chemotaxis protein
MAISVLVTGMIAICALVRNHCLVMVMAMLAVGELIQVILSGQLVSILALIAAIAGTIASLYSTWRTGDRRSLLGVIQDLRIRQDESDRRQDLAERDRALMRLQLTQMAAEYLREHGHLARTGKVFTLRRFTKPPEDTSVLIVEDHAPTRVAMQRLLDYYGFMTQTAADPETAIEMVGVAVGRGNPYDFVLLDMAFPGLSQGIDVLRATTAVSPDSHAIVITGTIEVEVVAKAERAGAAAVLPKPIDKTRLFGLMGISEEDEEIAQ